MKSLSEEIYAGIKTALSDMIIGFMTMGYQKTLDWLESGSDQDYLEAYKALMLSLSSAKQIISLNGVNFEKGQVEDLGGMSEHVLIALQLTQALQLELDRLTGTYFAKLGGMLSESDLEKCSQRVNKELSVTKRNHVRYKSGTPEQVHSACLYALSQDISDGMFTFATGWEEQEESVQEKQDIDLNNIFVPKFDGTMN